MFRFSTNVTSENPGLHGKQCICLKHCNSTYLEYVVEFLFMHFFLRIVESIEKNKYKLFLKCLFELVCLTYQTVPLFGFLLR